MPDMVGVEYGCAIFSSPHFNAWALAICEKPDKPDAIMITSKNLNFIPTFFVFKSSVNLSSNRDE